MSAPIDMKLAVVCSSNQNRSMEAHSFLSKKGFQHVKSFGSGNYVKLPGPSLTQPNVYDFNTSYEEMYQDLITKDKNLYTQNGILNMLDRNRRIKEKPERFQDYPHQFDLIITVEERVYDQVIGDLGSREQQGDASVHVINIDVLDNQEDATLGAFIICDLVLFLAESDDLDNDIDELLHDFEHDCGRSILHTVCFY